VRIGFVVISIESERLINDLCTIVILYETILCDYLCYTTGLTTANTVKRVKTEIIFRLLNQIYIYIYIKGTGITNLQLSDNGLG
jgi:hypothetical protein